MKRVLVVVDVQKGFAPFFDEKYLDDIKKYIESEAWDEVVVRYIGDEEHGIHNEKNEVLHYFYDANLLPSFLVNIDYQYSDRYFGYEFNDTEDTETIIEGQLWKVTNDCGTWFYSNTPNGDMYCPTKEIENLIYENAEIYIIGGFVDVCVKEVADFLKLASTNKVTIVDELCFKHSFNPGIKDALRFTNGWIKKD